MPRLFTALEIPARDAHASLADARAARRRKVGRAGEHAHHAALCRRHRRSHGRRVCRVARGYPLPSRSRSHPGRRALSEGATRACCGRAWRQASRWRRCTAPTSAQRAPPGWRPTRATSRRMSRWRACAAPGNWPSPGFCRSTAICACSRSPPTLRAAVGAPGLRRSAVRDRGGLSVRGRGYGRSSGRMGSLNSGSGDRDLLS